ncbi:MAG: hypothetical protein IPK72_21915 [Candidatus Eisenbacteria bacterium]|nr:hypothetical protein [Candidatus Eisenbacteria bacterium]
MQPVDVQDVCRISAGGSGYLAVWQDNRTNLLGFANMAYEPLTGNGLDIYGLRLDQHGNPIDPGPFVICQLDGTRCGPKSRGTRRHGPGWSSSPAKRDDWYFFTDVLGVRVGADGASSTPSRSRSVPKNNDPANDRADALPTVASATARTGSPSGRTSTGSSAAKAEPVREADRGERHDAGRRAGGVAAASRTTSSVRSPRALLGHR